MLSEPDLSWSGLDRVWSWWLLGCLEWLECEAQYYPVTSGRHFWADWFWYWLIIFSYIMRKYAYRRRGYRDISPRTPSTESSVETSPGINWPTMRIFIPRQFSWFIILVLSLAISLGLFLQLSTLKYSYKTYQLTMAWIRTRNVVGHGSLAGGWICVYVPEGTVLINPFLIMQLERITIRSMNLISLSLDMVPGLKDGRSIRLTTSWR